MSCVVGHGALSWSWLEVRWGGFVPNVDCRFGSNFNCRLLTEEPKCRCRFDYFRGVIVDLV